MAEEGFKRKLTAILSADVEGYSRLMDDDEEATVRTLTSYRNAITDLVQQYRGRVVDSPGDNILAEFASVVDSVNCAVEIQRELAERNEELPDKRKMQFRIGVNLGDVIDEDGRIYGDGVNIAARVESLAEAGGICLSGRAHDQVENKLGLEYEDLGKHEVKNISRPIQVYRVLSYPGAAAHRVVQAKKTIGRKWLKIAISVAMVAAFVAVIGIWQVYMRRPTIEPASLEKMALPLPNKPSIAVLPFNNLTDNPDQDYFSDGITEEIITALAKIPKLLVIARNSTFAYKGKPVKVQQVSEELGVQYVLEGSVRRTEDRVRITAQLIDALKGHHIWAEKYDRDIQDIFDIQDEITKRIITALQIELTEGQQAGIYARGTGNLEAYLKIMQANSLYNQMNKESVFKARALAKEAIALDPNYAFAYKTLGSTYGVGILLGLGEDPQETLKQTIELMRKAIELDDRLAIAHGALGFYLVWARQYDKSVDMGKRAFELEPNSADVIITYATILSMVGEPERAIPLYKEALRLNPKPPSSHVHLYAIALRDSERYEEAIEQAKRAIEVAPNNLVAHVVLTSSLSLAGRNEEARAAAQEILRINPNFSVTPYQARAVQKDKDLVKRICDALREAGLPNNPPLPLPDKPSIAVLAFDNLSGDPEQEYFSDGITDDIITALSKASKMFVIARNSTFTYKGRPVRVQQIGRELGVRYVLEGSVRKIDDKVRITAQLVDARSGHHLWAEKYDRDLKDIFALQDEITKKILSELQIKLAEGEIARSFERGTKSLDAYFALLKGREYYYRQDREGNSIARNFFQEALEFDPDYASAYSHLARTHFMDMWLGSSQDPRASLEQALKLAQKSISFNGNSADAHAVSGYIRTLMRQYEQAIAEGKKAVELNPNSDLSQFLYGLTLHYVGRRNEAIRLMESAIRLNPMPTSVYYNYLGSAYYHSGRYEEAVSAFKKAIQLSPSHQWANLGLAITYSLQGRDDEAHAAAVEALKINPNFTIEHLSKNSPYKNQEDIDRMVTAMQNAGLK